MQDPVTWYRINYTGTQITQWDFQNKGKSGWTGKSSFVLEVPLRHLRPSVIYSVPCDRILQRAYSIRRSTTVSLETYPLYSHVLNTFAESGLGCMMYYYKFALHHKMKIEFLSWTTQILLSEYFALLNSVYFDKLLKHEQYHVYGI